MDIITALNDLCSCAESEDMHEDAVVAVREWVAQCTKVWGPTRFVEKLVELTDEWQ